MYLSKNLRILNTTFEESDGLVPSSSAFSKFGLSILKFFKHAQFFMYTQNHFGVLKIWISLHKLAHLSLPKMF